MLCRDDARREAALTSPGPGIAGGLATASPKPPSNHGSLPRFRRVSRERLSPYRELQVDEVELFSEQYDVRESVKRNLYTGRTYNSLDNIAQFFAERGMSVPSGITRAQEARSAPPAPQGPKADVRILPGIHIAGESSGCRNPNSE